MIRLISVFISFYLFLPLTAELRANDDAEQPKQIEQAQSCHKVFTLLRGFKTFDERFFDTLFNGKSDAEKDAIYERLKGLRKFSWYDRPLIWFHKKVPVVGALSADLSMNMWEVLIENEPKDIYKIIMTPIEKNTAWKAMSIRERQSMLLASFYLMGYHVFHWGKAIRMRRIADITNNLLMRLKAKVPDSKLIETLHSYFIKTTQSSPFQVYMSPNFDPTVLTRVFSEDFAMYKFAEIVKGAGQKNNMVEGIDKLIKEEQDLINQRKGIDKISSNIWLGELKSLRAYLAKKKGFWPFSNEEVKNLRKARPWGEWLFRLPRSLGYSAGQISRTATKLALTSFILYKLMYYGQSLLFDMPEHHSPIPNAQQIQLIIVDERGVTGSVPSQKLLDELKELQIEAINLGLSSTDAAVKKRMEILGKIQSIKDEYPGIGEFMRKSMFEGIYEQ